MDPRLNSLGQGDPWGVQRLGEQWGLERGTEPPGVLCTLDVHPQPQGERDCSQLSPEDTREWTMEMTDTADRQGGCWTKSLGKEAGARPQEDRRDAQPGCSGTPEGTKGLALILQGRWKRTQCRLNSHSLGWGVGLIPRPQAHLPPRCSAEGPRGTTVRTVPGWAWA